MENGTEGSVRGMRLPIGSRNHCSRLSSFVGQNIELWFGSFRDAYGMAWNSVEVLQAFRKGLKLF